MIETSTYQRNAVQRKQMHYSPNLLSVISNAIDNRKVATIEYDSYEKGVTIREVEPIAVVYKDRRRTLVAWCRLRNDYRPFRLDKLNCIKLNQEEFTRRQDFNINDFQDDPNEVYHEEYEEAH
ncbi:MAG: WYL domain-containing protein [Bacteroidota bacterium]